MDRYGATIPTAATAASTEQPIATLWNPSTTKSIYVRGISIFHMAATAGLPRLRRASARGTAGASFTPGVESHYDHTTAPESGAILDGALFSVVPTFLGTIARGISSANIPAAIGAGFVWVFEVIGIRIKPGQGLSLVAAAASYPAAEVAFTWDE